MPNLFRNKTPRKAPIQWIKEMSMMTFSVVYIIKYEQVGIRFLSVKYLNERF
jgi:hypothetical protein